MLEYIYRMAQDIIRAETGAEYLRSGGWDEAADRWEKIARQRQRDAELWAAAHIVRYANFPMQVQWARVLLGYCR